MPEVPEVETVVRDLRPLVVGRPIASVLHGPKKLRKPWHSRWNRLAIGTRVEAVRRRGKWIVVDLSNSSCLLVHLGMTGQFTVVGADEPVADHVHMVFVLDDGRELRCRDPRRFGSVTLHSGGATIAEFFVKAALGPEPFDLDAAYFESAVRRSSRTLKAILLDQRVVAGVGNIYADESCFVAGLHPRRRGTSLSRTEADRLRVAIEGVLERAIARRGSTIRDYVGGSGLRGGFQHEFRVYGRTGEPCLTCATAIACLRLSGRASHYCPSCQRAGSRSRRPSKPRVLPLTIDS
jgi:formamidopyrimidine-DNA glycosylase